jgi:hypothetical protein
MGLGKGSGPCLRAMPPKRLHCTIHIDVSKAFLEMVGV